MAARSFILQLDVSNGLVQSVTASPILSTDLPAGTGSGSVTSVALAGPAEVSITGSPVTTSGTLTFAWASQTANKVFASPDGASGTPTFRALVAADVPNLDAGKITTGTLGVARGGTGVDGSAAANGVLLIGNGTGYSLATLTAGSGVTVTNGAGTITVAATAGAGSPLTTKGDLYGFSTVAARVAVGTNGQVLTADSTQATGVKWATIAGTGTVTSVNGSGGTTGLVLTGGPITTSGTLTLGGLLALANGGTGANLSGVLTGGMIAASADGVLATVAPNTTTVKKFLAETGSGTAGTLPSWQTLIAADLPLNTLADQVPALDDQVASNSAANGNQSSLLRNMLALLPGTPGGRLTLTTGLPVTTGDVTGATSIFYTPYVNDRIVLWNTGTVEWQAFQFTEKTLALGTLTSGLPYDVFGFIVAGLLALESLAWTSTTARATAVTLQDGRYCKSGDKSRLYLGTFYTTSTTTTEDSTTKRFLWNFYNRKNRRMFVTDTTSHTYNSATYRQWRSQTANKYEFVLGLQEDPLQWSLYGVCNAALAGTPAIVAIGFDSITVPSITAQYSAITGQVQTAASGRSYLAPGYHFLAALESGDATNPPTFASFLMFGGVDA